MGNDDDMSFVRAAVAIAAAVAGVWLFFRSSRKDEKYDPVKRRLVREEITTTEETYVKGLGKY